MTNTIPKADRNSHLHHFTGWDYIQAGEGRTENQRRLNRAGWEEKTGRRQHYVSLSVVFFQFCVFKSTSSAIASQPLIPKLQNRGGSIWTTFWNWQSNEHTLLKQRFDRDWCRDVKEWFQLYYHAHCSLHYVGDLGHWNNIVCKKRQSTLTWWLQGCSV